MRGKSDRPTIIDIAQAIGVSHTTVSYALRGDPRISRETAQKVREKARELNYRPNIIARALVRSGSSLVGLVLQHIRGSFYAEIIAGIQEELEARGYNIILCDSDYNEKKEAAHIRTLIDKQIEGLIVNPVNIGKCDLGVFQELRDQGVPLILVAGIKEGLEVPFVHGDNFQGGYLAGCHLLDLGHRHLVYLSINREEIERLKRSENLSRYEGCLQAVQTQGTNATLAVAEAFMEEVKPETLERLLAIEPRPTGIFAYSDLTAVRLIRQLQDRGFQVPRDFSIVGYDDLPIASLIRPPLTTLAQAKKELGACAALKLLGLMEGLRTMETLFKPTLVVRESTAPVSG